jgi:general secretion pathway protein D
MTTLANWRVLCWLLVLGCASSAWAQSPRGAVANDIDGIPLRQIIEAVAARTGQTFIVDPRVNATVKAPGLKLQELTFGDLQSILSVHGYTAVPVGSLFKIIPDDNVRQQPLPTLIDGERRGWANDDYVTKVLQPRKLSATALVTALRPLLPKQAQITANASTNSLIVVASEDDIKAVEVMMEKLEAAR